MMGLPRNKFADGGGTRNKGRSTSKEVDTAFKPAAHRPHENDWPTIVLEAGFSESVRQRRNDAWWWLSNIRSTVKIVLIFTVNRETRTVQIEKWETRPVTGPFTPSNWPPSQVPTPIQQIIIDPNNVTGAPLILYFHLIYLRAINQNAVPPEHDHTFTAQDFEIGQRTTGVVR